MNVNELVEKYRKAITLLSEIETIGMDDVNIHFTVILSNQKRTAVVFNKSTLETLDDIPKDLIPNDYLIAETSVYNAIKTFTDQFTNNSSLTKIEEQ